MKNLVSLLLALFILANNSVFAQLGQEDDFELLKNLEIYQNILKKLRNDYVYPVSSQKLITSAIDAMLKTLDPYTVYFPEEKIQDVRLYSEAKYVGVGILVKKLDSVFYVEKVFPNSPALKAGLKVGDKIVEVNGIPVTGKTMKEIHTLITGDPGTYVNFTIYRLATDKTLKIRIKRANINLEPIEYHTIYQNIGYIKLSQFTDRAYEEFREAFENMYKQSIKGLIIDLRDNPGGLLSEAVDILSTLLPKNTLVVTIKGKNKQYFQNFFTHRPPISTTLPVVVLVNKNSASASEIVAGALQDLDRAVIIGEQTVGKGLVQRIYDVGYNSKLKITIAKYYIPSGRCIQAIDYRTHKSTKHTPDSLLKKFYTANGRVVYEGKSIWPDIYVTDDTNSEFLQDLLAKDMLVFYASYLIQKNPGVTDAAPGYDYTSQLGEFLNRINYKYVPKTYKTYQKLLDELKSQGNKEAYGQLLSMKNYFAPELNSLIKENRDKLNDLIILYIAQLTGNKEKTFQINSNLDRQFIEALKVLRNENQYKEILNLN